MLALDNVNVYFGNSHVLQGVSLAVDAGKVTCLLGRNGAGKTTTISTIVGFLKPRAGTIRFDGANVTPWPVEKRARRGLSLVPQGRRIFPLLNVEENLTIGAQAKPDGWSLARVYDLFPRLKERRTSLGGRLSGGEQQMLAIGRTLMANPSFILMDEPSEGLAPIVIDEVYRVIDDLAKQGISILLVEHSLDQAITLASRIYILSKGRIAWQTDDARELNEDIRTRFLGVG